MPDTPPDDWSIKSLKEYTDAKFQTIVQAAAEARKLSDESAKEAKASSERAIEEAHRVTERATAEAKDTLQETSRR